MVTATKKRTKAFGPLQRFPWYGGHWAREKCVGAHKSARAGKTIAMAELGDVVVAVAVEDDAEIGPPKKKRRTVAWSVVEEGSFDALMAKAESRNDLCLRDTKSNGVKYYQCKCASLARVRRRSVSQVPLAFPAVQAAVAGAATALRRRRRRGHGSARLHAGRIACSSFASVERGHARTR